MAREDSIKPGPANHHAPEGLEAPTPPGGPQRQDAPDTSVTPGSPATPAQPAERKRVAEGGEAPTITPGHEGREPAEAPGELTDRKTGENAETSQVQPSDGSGSE